MKEHLEMKGKVEIVLKDSDGNIKDQETIDNLIVTVGKVHVADQLAEQSQAAMSHMAIGTGSVAPVVGNTSLGTELSRKTFDSKTQGIAPNNNQIIFETTWGTGEGVGAITEAGIFNASSGGTMLNRATFAVKNKASDDVLFITWTVTIP